MDLMKFLMHTVREFIWPSSLQSPLSFPTDVPKETIESIRDATIITTIDVEDNFISISTSDADNPEQENTVSFIPGDTLEISNPLNGETMEVLFTGLVPKNFWQKFSPVCCYCAQPYDDPDSFWGSWLGYNWD